MSDTAVNVLNAEIRHRRDASIGVRSTERKKKTNFPVDTGFFLGVEPTTTVETLWPRAAKRMVNERMINGAKNTRRTKATIFVEGFDIRERAVYVARTKREFDGFVNAGAWRILRYCGIVGSIPRQASVEWKATGEKGRKGERERAGND